MDVWWTGQEVRYMCALNTDAFPGSLALVTENSLTIGTIEEIQVLYLPYAGHITGQQ